MSLSMPSDQRPVSIPRPAKVESKSDVQSTGGLSVASGLAHLAHKSDKPDPIVSTKHDEQLRSAVFHQVHSERVTDALSGSGKAEKLVALIDSAVKTTDPQVALEAAFAKYFDASPKTVVDRMSKLSAAVASYADHAHREVISSALNTVLAFQMPIRLEASLFRSASVVGNSDHMEWLVTNASSTGSAHIEAAFSRYINDATGGDACLRVGRLSQAVYDYASLPTTSPEKAQMVGDSLRNVLATASVINELDQKFPKNMTPAEETRYFLRSDIKSLTQLVGGLVNPYLFQVDPSGKGEDMVSLVTDANHKLTTRTLSRGGWMNLAQTVQGRVHIGDTSAYERYQRFEQKDLGISPESQLGQNAYTVLGLQPDVDQSQLTALIKELHTTNYHIPGTPMFAVRNAVFQLQTPECKSEYDDYLRAKTDSSLEHQLRQKIVSEEDVRVLGTVQTGIRMHALLHCIREASGI